jgi:iron complex transport system ATP-binding protein
MNHHTTPLIETHHVSFAIDGAELLHDISLALHPGEVIGLIGPNGAGKSTLLRVLGGLWSGAVGEVLLVGHSLKTYSAQQIARLVGHVPQSTAMDFAFTVREVVLMGRSPYLGRFQLEGAEDRQVAGEAMRAMDVDHFADRLVNTLSGGERQRVFVARALAQQPRLLLLDEPTANLDVRHQVDMLEMVAKLAHSDGLAVLMAIHDLDLAAHYCDRLILLHEGQILADDSPEVVLTPDHLSTAFQVQARTFRDPFTDALRLSLLASNGEQVISMPETGSNGHGSIPQQPGA